MSEEEIAYHMLFVLFTFCLIYPPAEFVSIGLTINNIFGGYFGIEDVEFVQYHLRRTSFTLLAHTFMPFAYVVFYFVKFETLFVTEVSSIWGILIFVAWNSFVTFALTVPFITGAVVYIWKLNNWRRHPIAENLRKYCNADANWERVAADINAEFRSNDKITMQTSAIHFVAATQNWVMKVSNYKVNFAHQSDTALIAIKSDSHDINEISTDSVQFVSIKVKPTRPSVEEFVIRVNALDFRSLQDRMLRPITILDGVNFNRSVIERFIEVFKQQVDSNPRYKTNEVTESCFACMQAQPNIKLQKQCTDVDSEGRPLADGSRCGNCYCRPMWCIDCMAKWFASRQNQFEKEVWLQQKCSCPMCRTTFCILDVCYVEIE